jgi:hypothetical protein
MTPASAASAAKAKELLGLITTHATGDFQKDADDWAASCIDLNAFGEMIALALDAERARVWEEAAKEIPTTWLDPLLTGDRAAVSQHGRFDCQDIERLLNQLRERLRARAAEERKRG